MIFVDSGAWYALSDPRDKTFEPATKLFARVRRGEFGRTLTTDYVLDETYTLLRMRHGVEAVRRLRDLLTRSSDIQVVRISEHDFEEATDLMLDHGDKRWSFTDCTSFVVMRALQISDAFAFDRNFREAGIRSLPGD